MCEGRETWSSLRALEIIEHAFWQRLEDHEEVWD